MANHTLSSLWSSSIFFWAAFVLILTFISVDAGRRKCSADDYRAGAPKRGFICGSQIPQTLSLVCGGSYQSPGKRDLGSSRSPWNSFLTTSDDDDPWRKKTTNPVDDLDPAAIDDFDPAAIWDNVFLPRANALSVLRSKRSNMKEGGVYCECCVHRCTYPELQAYCGVERRKRAIDTLTQLTGIVFDKEKAKSTSP
ncbi:hypothetical protein CAPTEDRAFT_222461 [Capitella teleta]|uniref:Insulin-like domain-containing protein n=1 Tax=Capitella teleta TaxID=283909 RepID=R7TVR4_CAPTE|nr:hypothetical protein CAPTEDRAFT_222461 [Capitella teleta]|eukprot:ELT95556.1 hypothetical protein CAPTEDRAFT_222461 [Capitella teleta]